MSSVFFSRHVFSVLLLRVIRITSNTSLKVPDLSRDDAPSPEPIFGRDENEAQAWRDYLNTLGKINKDPDANHDDVALRDINGVELAIPRAERSKREADSGGGRNDGRQS